MRAESREAVKNSFHWDDDEALSERESAEKVEAEAILNRLARVFFPPQPGAKSRVRESDKRLEEHPGGKEWPDLRDTYRILVEQIPAVVFLAFLDKGIGEAYVSPQIETTLGFTQEEWLTDPVRWYSQIHPDDKARWSAEAANIFMTGEPLRSVYRVMARDGHVVWFHCEVKMVRQPNGRPWFIHGVGFDITDLKQVEGALSRSEEMLRGIFEFAPDTIVVIGRDGRIKRVNAQVERMFGYRIGELLEQPIEIFVPERFGKQHQAYRKKYAKDPHIRPMGAGLTLYGRRKDGSEFPVEIMLSPVEGGPDGLVIAVIRDISRRQRDQEALRNYAERMEVLSRRLLSVQEQERRNIALELHDEIGQILTGLKLKLEMSARLTDGDAHDTLVEAQSLVNELMARTRKLSLDLRPATLDHLGLLPALIWHVRQYTAQTQVRVNFWHSGIEGRRFPPELETAAFRIVQEALTNVVRHSESDEASVRIWVDHETLTVQIEDQGIGFDSEKALAVGQSNGLTGMRERALLLGGRFTVESKGGAGKGGGARLKAEWNLSHQPARDPAWNHDLHFQAKS
jgi:PAS domain S-box-containing protein